MYENSANAPTEKQINAIRKLARNTNTSVDVESITSKQEASSILDELIGKRNGRNANGGNEHKDRKCAYGLAVKLVFGRYQQLSINHKSEEFWKEVDEFYRQYIEHLDRAMKSGSQR